ncbi:MAG: hypothetical protein K0V04_08315 [Deltaproteobacteria bacterium]|nr:hypothetical protein [Deltaproteobacteria bacterium]
MPDRNRRDSTSAEVSDLLRRGLKSTLARWVITKRRGARPTPPPSPQDEATHAWDGRRHFAEDYTFIGVQAQLGIIVRLEWLPGRDSQRVWVTLLRPDGVWALPAGQAVLRTTNDDRWQAGGLKLDCVRPLRRWTIRFVGSLHHQGQGEASEGPSLRLVDDDDASVQRGSVDLTFVSDVEPYEPGADDDPELMARHLGEASWDRRLLQAARRARSRGYVQLGQLHGTIALGDVLIPVRADSVRHHHWGVRDWGACDDAYQCFLAMDGGRRGWVHHARFPFVTLEGGFVEDKGRVEPIRGLGTSLEARPQRAPTRMGLSLLHAEGAHQVEAALVSDVSLVVDGRGRVDLGLVRVASPEPGWGIWAGLRRARPRR